jgi:hypothetical protein
MSSNCCRRLSMWTLILTLVATAAPAQDGGGEAPPKAWFLAGSHPANYEAGADRSTRYIGKSSGFLRSRKPNPEGFGTYMQMVLPDRYRGKRVRMSGFVKAENVTGWAGLWMRVDGPTPNTALAFDNMQDRPIRGTSDWKKYEVVLDVAAESSALAFGFLLGGAGQIWLDGLKFEVVGPDVPTTDLQHKMPLAPEPRNLDFEGSP